MKKLYLNLRIMVISVVMATIFLFAGSAGSFAQDIVKVKTDGQAYTNDHQNHLTWENATSDLQAAIDDLADNGGGEIWVAGGTYFPTKPFSADPDIEAGVTENRYKSFVMAENVTIRGGFNGDETNIGDRPEDLFETGNTTILSGDIGTADDPLDNSYHVVIFPHGTSELAILDGFMITGGNADNGVDFDGRGGGIHAREGGYVINCQITGNNAGARGGGAYLYKGGLIENCAISENQAGIEGGGIFLNQGGEVTHSAIYSNICQSDDSGTAVGNGGGVFLTSNNDLHGAVTYSVITANYSANKGGGASIYEESGNNGYPGGQLINNLIANNEAVGNGGGVHTQNAGYILNNTIVRNQSDGGGGVYSNNGGQIINSVLWGNTTTSYDPNAQFQWDGTETATADYCAIENGTEDDANITNLVSLEPENAGTEGLYPYFMNPASFSGLPETEQEDELAQSDYSIMDLASDLIDAGNPDTASPGEFNGYDLAGNPRFTKLAIDIGAYEVFYHTVNTEVTNETGGTLTPEQPTNVLDGENIQFTLTPDDNNEVISFTINGTEYKDQLTEENSAFLYTTSVTEDLDAVAEFGIPSSLPDAARKDIFIYPNPADRVLYIRGITINQLKIHSMNGKTVKNIRNIQRSGIDVSDLETGIYFIEIEDENQKKHIMKFIKK